MSLWLGPGLGGVDSSDGSTYKYEKAAGFCKSDLDAEPAALGGEQYFTLDTCWNACVSENGAENINNVEYDCDQDFCWCFCQSSCDCMDEIGQSSTARWSTDTSDLPSACADDTPYDDGDDDVVLSDTGCVSAVCCCLLLLLLSAAVCCCLLLLLLLLLVR